MKGCSIDVMRLIISRRAPGASSLCRRPRLDQSLKDNDDEVAEGSTALFAHSVDHAMAGRMQRSRAIGLSPHANCVAASNVEEDAHAPVD